MHMLAYLSAFLRQVFMSLLISPLLRNLVTPLWVNYHATLKWGLCFSNFPTESKYQCLLSATTSALHQRELIRSTDDTIHNQDSYMHMCIHTLITHLSTALTTDSEVGRVVRSKANLGSFWGAYRSKGWAEGRWEWEVEPLLGPEWRVNGKIWAETNWAVLNGGEQWSFLIVPLVFILELWLLL